MELKDAMADLGTGQKPIVMSHYPHMLSEDIEVWSKFLAKMSKVITRVWYDLHVGKPARLPAGSSDVLKKVAAGVTRKRIDAVCLVGREYWVIEVKPFANMTALGQAFSYSRLFALEYENYKPVKAVVVCDSVDADMVGPYGELGVMVFVNE